jgi:SET domain-containing protein
MYRRKHIMPPKLKEMIKQNRPKVIAEINKEVDDYVNTSPFDLYIDNSKIIEAGLGVYTRDFIPENTIIDEYRGKLIETDNPITNEYYYELIAGDKSKGILTVGIDASALPRNYMGMINDASFDKVVKNNCEFQDDVENKKVYVVTLRDIQPDEELFASYGDGYWHTF